MGFTKFQVSYYFWLLSLLFSSCPHSSEEKNIVSENVGQKTVSFVVYSQAVDTSLSFSYNMKEYSAMMSLSRELVEISGLSYDLRRDRLVAVQDENGVVYFINRNTGEIEEKFRFAGNGDYEGIEMVNETVHIVKSNGNIYGYDLSSKRKLGVIKTPLSLINDVEGLAYDHERHRLILACKGRPGMSRKKKQKEQKALYAFDLTTQKMDSDALCIIEDKGLESLIRSGNLFLNLSKKKIGNYLSRVRQFSPSGISVHPVSGDYYILSSQGKTLVVVERSGHLKQIIMLDKNIHRQPEGICFAPNGDMYLSNEGKGFISKIYLYRIQYQKKVKSPSE